MTDAKICFFQSDAEEAKSQEITKLKLAYQEMERQVKETKELLAKEKVAVKIASEKEALVKEVPVVDTALVDKLTAENESLKVLYPSTLSLKFRSVLKFWNKCMLESALVIYCW